MEGSPLPRFAEKVFNPGLSSRDQAIIRRYLAGESPGDIAKDTGRSTSVIKELVRRSGLIRTQSDAAKLAALQGKKDKAVKALAHANKTFNRRNPAKVPWRNDPTKHPRWKADRSEVKKGRTCTEERHFFREILKEANYTCQLTGKRGGELSVHHFKPVWEFPELRYDRSAVIVIQRKIHKHFHKLFGLKASHKDWSTYVQGGYYLALSK